MTRVALNRALGEGFFNYDYTWRTNSSIIGSFIGCLARTDSSRWEMIKFCSNLFSPVWCKGIEEVIMSFDNCNRVPLPEEYMAYLPGCSDLDNV